MSSDQHNLDLLNPIIKEDPMAENNQFLSQSPSEDNSSYTAPPPRPKQRHIYESPEAKARRLGMVFAFSLPTTFRMFVDVSNKFHFLCF